MSLFDQHQTRQQYLERLLAQYGTVTLPLTSTNLALPLQTVVQPMILRRDPLTPPDKQAKNEQEVVKASNGLEALARSEQRRIIILGGPGIGKTTALKALLHTSLLDAQRDPAAPLPLFISLPDLARTRLSFEHYLHHLITEMEFDPSFAEILIEAVHTGNAFLCLDSLDEVLPALRPDLIALLNTEAPRCQGTWIIGSRFTEYQGGQFTHSQFTEWELQPLNEQERLDLARRLLPALSEAIAEQASQMTPVAPSAEEFLKALHHQQQIAAWGENPLLLSLAAILYLQTGTLPASRTLLYAHVTEAMFAMRLHDAEQRAALRHILAELALELYQTRGRTCSIADLLKLLPSLIADQSTHALYATLAQILDAGVLEPVTSQTYSFKHQMFQEYLAAVALARRSVDDTQRHSTWDFLWRKRRLSRWKEIVRLLVGILVHEYGAEGRQFAHEWLSALAREQSTPEGDPGDLCLILALQSLSEYGVHVTDPAVEPLAQQIVEIWAKRYAEVSRLGGWLYTQPLQQQTSILCTLSLHCVAPILLRLWENDPYVQTFCPIPPAADIAVKDLPLKLLWYLFHDSPPISVYACHTRRILQTPVVIERLAALLEETGGHWSHEDQANAVKLLGCMGEQTPFPLLQKIWQDPTRDEAVRIATADALIEAEIPIPFDVLYAMLQDQCAAIRCRAVNALSKQNGHTHADLLVSAVHDHDFRVRASALQCLHELGFSLPIEILQTQFFDKHSSVCTAAWHSLQALGERMPVEFWLKALRHEHEHVRNHALQALERYRDQISVESILAMFSFYKQETYRHKDVRIHFIKALELLGERVPVELLLTLLHHSDEHLRAYAFFALKQRHVALPTNMMLLMLQDPSTGNAAAHMIAAMGADAPIPSLLQMAQHCNSISVFLALRLLYQYMPTGPVLELLHDEEMKTSYWHNYEELINLLLLQGAEIPLEWLLPILRQHTSGAEIAPVLATLCRAGAQAPIEPLLRLCYEERFKSSDTPKWAQQLFYVLHEWVSPEHLINALGNTPDDQQLAVSLLGLIHDDVNIQLLTTVAQDPSRDWTTRIEAIVVLNELDVNLPMNYLLQAIRLGTYIGVENCLIETVKRLGKQTPIEQLLPSLGEDHRHLHYYVVEALIGIIEHIPLETILPLLQDNNTLVRHAAIQILGAMREHAPLDVLIALLNDPEQSIETRSKVLSALSKMGIPAAMDPLLEALQNDVAKIRRSALLALRDNELQNGLKGVSAFKGIDRERLFEPVLRLLHDPNDEVVQEALALLGDLGNSGIAVPIEPMLSLLSSQDTYTAECAIEALCKLGEHCPIDALLAIMSDPQFESIHSTIFHKLSTLGPLAPVKAMLSTLSEDFRVRGEWYIVFALENLVESMPEQMIQLLQDDPRPVIRRIVLLAIQESKACEFLPLVLATLDDVDGRYAAYDNYHSDGTVRSAAIKTLGALATCAPIEPLLELLSTNNQYCRTDGELIIILNALRHFGSPVPLNMLLPLLGSHNTSICELAFQHIQKSYPDVLQELVPQLKAMLREEPVQGAFAPRMHYRIAETVAIMGRATPAVLDMVIVLLDHPFWEVRVRAAKTLGTLRHTVPDSALQRLLELRKDPESLNVRLAADQALAALLSLEQGMEDE